MPIKLHKPTILSCVFTLLLVAHQPQLRGIGDLTQCACTHYMSNQFVSFFLYNSVWWQITWASQEDLFHKTSSCHKLQNYLILYQELVDVWSGATLRLIESYICCVAYNLPVWGKTAEQDCSARPLCSVASADALYIAGCKGTLGQ